MEEKSSERKLLLLLLLATVSSGMEVFELGMQEEERDEW